MSAILLLAIGIGASAAAYSVFDTAVLRSLPYPHAEQLVTVENVDLPYDFGTHTHKPRAYASDLAGLRVFSTVANYAIGSLNFGGDDAPLRVAAAYVTHDFFRTLGGAPIIGRVFTVDEGTNAGDFRVAVLSHRLWMQEFGGASAAIGQSFFLNGQRYRVAGIMSPGFRYPSDPDLWLPMPLPVSNPEMFEAFGLFIPSSTVARLRPGVSRRTANAAVVDIERTYPTWSFVTDSAAREIVRPLQASLVGERARRPLIALTAAAALVLLLSCANLAALLAARNIDRRRDLEIRMILGASRAQLLTQPLAEALFLSVAGAIGGVIVSTVSMGALAALLPPSLLSIARPTLDRRVLLFTIALTTIMAAGIALTFTMTTERARVRFNRFTTDLRVASRGSVAAREILCGAEIAIALVLIVAAGLMLDSLHGLMSVDIGFRPSGVSVAQVTLPRASYPTPSKVVPLVQTAVTTLVTVPGITSAGAVNSLPLGGHARFGIVLTTPENPADSLFPLTYAATPGYFGSMGIPLLRGRDFRWTDGPGQGVLVNAATARHFWTNGDAIGRSVIISDRVRTIVGVVGNVRTERLEDTAAAQVYLPFSEGTGNTVNIVVQTHMKVDVSAARIRDAVRSSDPTLPVYGVRRMEDLIAASVAAPRAAGTLLGVFSAIALILAGIGVYGITAYSVGARRREFAVRLAVGAEPRELFVRVLRRAALLAAAGIAAGSGLAIVGTQLIRSLLFNVSPLSVPVFASAGTVLFVTAVLGAFGPAVRGLNTDPMESLRVD